MSSRKDEIAQALDQVRSEIAPFNPTLIVVTKTYPLSDVEILASLGVGEYGENRDSEGAEKAPAVPGRWHFQGEIQSKKLRSILTWANCIQSLDSLDHAKKIDRICSEMNQNIDLFLQLSLDGDPSRGGVQESELMKLSEEVTHLPQINLMGIMSVPPVSADPKEAFAEISSIHQRFKATYPSSPYLSAGMSGDYLLALSHGATHIRVGSKILGARHYDQ